MFKNVKAFTIAVLPILLIIILASFLRFTNLGYSEFQDDEKKAFIRNGSDETVYNFLLNQRKGPLQFFLTSATVFFTHDARNEFLVRLPFTIANLLSVLVVYLILKEYFSSRLTAVFGSTLYMANGFVVGFSRIAQYQNLNLLFSFLAVYLFLKCKNNPSKAMVFSLLGTLAFSLSLLAHWDAIFFVIPIIYFYGRFISDKSIPLTRRVKITLFNLLFGLLLLLPFLVPYVQNQFSNTVNTEYFERRVGTSQLPISRHKFIFDLYNPFITLPFMFVLFLIGLVNYRKSAPLIFWFSLNFLVIFLLMKKPGTHIYNYIIPAIFVATSGFAQIRKNKYVLLVFALPVIAALAFVNYQSYKIFVDHSPEYPWYPKIIFSFKNIILHTPFYDDKEVLTFGFPHFRNWKSVNEAILNDSDKCTYITNEGKEISQIYTLEKYGILKTRSCYFIVDVERPFITREDGVVFSQIRNKTPVYSHVVDGHPVTEIYKIKVK